MVLTLTTWGGIYGLTFFMVYFNVSLAQGLAGFFGERRQKNWAAILWPVLLLALALIWGALKIDRTAFERKGTVAMLQPSIPQEEKWSRDNEMATYRKLGALVKDTNSLRPDLILWPETGAPDYLSWSWEALKSVKGIVRSSRTNHLVGCLDAEKDAQDPKTHSFNAAMAFTPDGRPGGTYHKRHLVPFGEFVPFQRYLRFLGPVVGDLGNFDRGERYESFRANGFTYTPLICYEVIFPGDVGEALKSGAEVIVNISNDAWYGKTASAYQHAQMALVRAAEHHKPLLRCSNAGVCLATDPLGRVLGSTRLFDVRYLGAEVLTMKDGTTLYSRFGNWVPYLCVLWGLALLVFSWRMKPEAEG
jgi:apolipoprotein N-acyltransferase